MEIIKELKNLSKRIKIVDGKAKLNLRYGESVCPKTYSFNGDKEIRDIANYCKNNNLVISLNYEDDEEYGWTQLVIKHTI